MRAPTWQGFWWLKRDNSDQWEVMHAAPYGRGGWMITYCGNDQQFELSEAFKKTKLNGLVSGDFKPCFPPTASG